MTLLITILAAVVSTLVWYRSPKRAEMRLGVLSLMYWGASIMWFVDAIFEFAELKEEFFNAALADILNDSLLGISVVVLGLVAWLILVLIKDPLGVIRHHKPDNE
ncbi:MAG: hypothetical protein J6Y68_00205 [Clostridia bacterium]|nr:hypothetical protein [Clostridia bacterium]MBP5593716.1 hypothetical protein [Clostridia bacterium]MBP5649160.1 hypothetical protein [Clostridia bacterium]